MKSDGIVLYWLGQQQTHNKMISGVNLSQIYEVQQTLHNHYQKLDEIVNHKRKNFSLNNQKLERVVEQHKTLHDHWRKYKNKKQHSEMKRDNDAFQKKLASIMMRKSRYNVKQSVMKYGIQEPLSISRGHHYYMRKKRDLSIQTQNPQIANRIVNAQGSLNLMKCRLHESQKLAQRLEKYPIMRRMFELSGKKLITDANEINLNGEEKQRSKSQYKNQRANKFARSPK